MNEPEMVPVDFDRLQAEAEALVRLLKDRQPGLASWCAMTQDRMRRLRVATNEMLGPNPTEQWNFLPEGSGGTLYLSQNGHIRPIATIQPAPGTAGHVIDTGRRIARLLTEETNRRAA